MLDDLVIEGFVHAYINWEWYGLKKGGNITYDDLVKILENKAINMLGKEMAFSNELQQRYFSRLSFYDFGIKYINKDFIHYLIVILWNKYTFMVDFDGKQHIIFYLDWDYFFINSTYHQCNMCRMMSPNFSIKQNFLLHTMSYRKVHMPCQCHWWYHVTYP